MKENCAYCAKAELKENSFVRIVLGEDNLEEWRRKQLEDPVVFTRKGIRKMSTSRGHCYAECFDESLLVILGFVSF